MKIAEIVRVDSKGRVTIPMVVREALNIVEGMSMVLIADTESREIILSPLSAKPDNLYEVRIEFRDVPGMLARIAEVLAKHNVDQVTTQCASVKRGEIAECILVVDLSKADIDSETLKQKLLEMPEVQMVTVKQIKK